MENKIKYFSIVSREKKEKEGRMQNSHNFLHVKIIF